MTDGYLLDTNIVGPYFSGHPHVLAKIQNLPGTDLLFVSAITLFFAGFCEIKIGRGRRH